MATIMRPVSGSATQSSPRTLMVALLLGGCAGASVSGFETRDGGTRADAEAHDAGILEVVRPDHAGLPETSPEQGVSDARSERVEGCPSGCASCDWGRWDQEMFPDADPWNTDMSDAISCYLRAVLDGLRPPADARYDVTVEQGADSTYQEDAAPAIQRAIANAAPGKWVYLPSGHYRLGRDLLMRAGVRFFAEHGAHLYKAFSGGNGWDGGMVSSQTMGESCEGPCWEDGDIDDVTVIGGTWHGAERGGSKVSGHIFNWDGDKWTVKGIFVERYEGARVFAWVGGEATLEHIVVRRAPNSAGNACMMPMGTAAEGLTVVRYTDMQCGDDCWGAFAGARGAGRYAERHVRNVLFEHGRCESLAARSVAGGLHRKPGQITMRNDITNITWRNLYGRSSNDTIGAVVMNTSSGEAGAGRVRNIRLEQVKLRPAADTPREMLKIHDVEQLVLDRVDVEAASGTVLLLQGLTGASVRESRFGGAIGSHTVRVAQDDCSEISWQETEITGLCAGQCCPN